MQNSLRCLFITVALLIGIYQAAAQGTAFTYQGQLNDDANPANGNFDLRFTLFDAVTNGDAIGSLTNTSTSVSNGLFIVTLDFGSVFNGSNYWLEIAVCTNDYSAFTTLNPRQPITATPYAIHSANALIANSANSVSAANIIGMVPLTALPTAVITNNASGVNLNGNFSGNGMNITNLNLNLNSFGAISWPGNFTLVSSPVAGANPQVIVTADVNGDHKPDIISADDSNHGKLMILTNNGSGFFGSNAVLYVGDPALSTHVWVTAADVNGDSNVDLICVDSGENSLIVFTNNGSGAFGSNATLNVDSLPYSVIAADVNGDGSMDLISANQGSFPNYIGTLTVLTNNGSGIFSSNATYSVGKLTEAVVAADINGDGKPDLICANYGDNTLSVLTNNGSGIFGSNATINVGNSPTAVIAADVNGDGYLDLICANGGDNSLSVLTNNGSGVFTSAGIYAVGGGPFSIAAADVNGDGKVDLISANSGTFGVPDSSLSVLTNNGSGGFVTDGTYAVGSAPESVVAADFNGDGMTDLICANFIGGTLSVLFNTPTFDGVFNGNGGGLVDLSATNLVGTISDARLSANVALLNGNQTFTGTNTFNNASGNFAGKFSGSFSGSGGGLTGLTNISASAIVGGLTTNIVVNVPTGTKTLFFTNGILRAVQ